MRGLKYMYLDDNKKYYYDFKNEIISGKELLIQNIIMNILTKKGTNEFIPLFGSQILIDIGQTIYSEVNIEELRLVVSLGIANIKDKLLLEQIQQNNLLSSEKLVDLILSNFTYNSDLQRFEIALEIKTEAGVTQIPINL